MNELFDDICDIDNASASSMIRKITLNQAAYYANKSIETFSLAKRRF